MSFVCVAFMSASLGLQAITGKRLNTQFTASKVINMFGNLAYLWHVLRNICDVSLALRLYRKESTSGACECVIARTVVSK